MTKPLKKREGKEIKIVGKRPDGTEVVFNEMDFDRIRAQEFVSIEITERMTTGDFLEAFGTFKVVAPTRK